MKTAVYPGSFNPLHIGHLAILRYLTSEMDFDQVYLIVSPQNTCPRRNIPSVHLTHCQDASRKGVSPWSSVQTTSSQSDDGGTQAGYSRNTE